MKFTPNGLRDRMMSLGQGGGGAAELVQRTLAQHGLAGPMHLPFGQAGPDRADLPAGARFDSGTFACAAGERAYLLYIPASAQAGVKGLVVMLHGCGQAPQDFAAGTAMNRHAEQNGLAVLYPAQARGANAQSCWNWFSKADQRRDRGEPAILSAMTRKIAADHDIDAGRIFVAGLSAGGAMALILGTVYPDLYAAVGVHSGLPYGAAGDMASAFAVMAGQAASGGVTRPAAKLPPVIVFHGSADTTVHPDNGLRIAQEALPQTGPQVQSVDRGQAGGRNYVRSVTSGTGSAPMVEHWLVEGMGHAWSGGDGAGSYTDTQGPDASAEMLRFFLETSGA